MQRWEDQYKEWVYRFRIEHPTNRDACVLICARNRWVDGKWENQVLTTDGWHRYNGFEVWPTNLPEISGLDLRHDSFATKRLLDGVREALEASGAEDIRMEV